MSSNPRQGSPTEPAADCPDLLAAMGYNSTHYPTHLRHLVPEDCNGTPVRLVGPPAPAGPPLETPPSVRRLESDSSPVTSESSLSGGSSKRGKSSGLSRIGRRAKSSSAPSVEKLEGEVVDIHVETAATVPPPVEVALEHSRNGGGIDDVMQTRWDYSRVMDADSGMTRVYSSHRLNAELAEDDDDSSDGEYVMFGEDSPKSKKGLIGSLQTGLKRTVSKKQSNGDDESERGAMRSSRGFSSSFHLKKGGSNFDDNKSEKSIGRSLRALSFRKSAEGDGDDTSARRSLSFRSKGGDSKSSRSMNLRSAMSGKIGGGRGLFGRSSSKSSRFGDENEDQDWDLGSADNFDYNTDRSSRRNRGRLGFLGRRG